jgi:molybdopterin-guanine dinucleotide biosynthesis protein A
MEAGPLAVGGYVLAGGRSSRMGRDKALLELRGRPLVELAVERLRGVCAEVKILGGNRELARYARLVEDLHPGCGPMGGMEAALTDSGFDWNLILPVDMPLLTTEFLREWAVEVVGRSGVCAGLFAVGGRVQPLPAMVRREVGEFLSGAMERGEYKLLPALEGAARALGGEVRVRDAGEQAGCFANVNTPEEFAAVGGDMF